MGCLRYTEGGPGRLSAGPAMGSQGLPPHSWYAKLHNPPFGVAAVLGPASHPARSHIIILILNHPSCIYLLNISGVQVREAKQAALLLGHMVQSWKWPPFSKWLQFNAAAWKIMATSRIALYGPTITACLLH